MPPIMPPPSRSYVTIWLIIVGLVSTLFGVIVFALPQWILDGLLTNSDCGDRCVPPTPPEHTVIIRPLAIVVAFTIFGFLPLVIYLLVSICQRRGKHEAPTRSDHPNELW